MWWGISFILYPCKSHTHIQTCQHSDQVVGAVGRSWFQFKQLLAAVTEHFATKATSLLSLPAVRSDVQSRHRLCFIMGYILWHKPFHCNKNTMQGWKSKSSKFLRVFLSDIKIVIYVRKRTCRTVTKYTLGALKLKISVSVFTLVSVQQDTPLHPHNVLLRHLWFKSQSGFSLMLGGDEDRNLLLRQQLLFQMTSQINK